VVERIVALLAAPMEIGGHELTVSGSVGVSFVGAGVDAPSSLADLLREADAAMYRAKAKGRNRWERLEPESAELHPRYCGVRNDGTAPSSARSDHRVGAVSPTSVR
jgi:hypothetical protein